VHAALETMGFLSGNRECAKMFVDAVKKQMIYGHGANKKMAQSVFLKLQTTASSDRVAPGKKPLGEITNTEPRNAPRIKPRHAVGARTTHVFNIPSVTEESRDEIEMKLLGVPGIASFVIDVEKGTLTVRSTDSDGSTLKRRLHSQYGIPIELTAAPETVTDYLEDDLENDSNDKKGNGWGSWLVSFGAPQKAKPTQREKAEQNSSWTPWASGLKSVGQGLGVL
jgi:hypothetical protein